MIKTKTLYFFLIFNVFFCSQTWAEIESLTPLKEEFYQSGSPKISWTSDDKTGLMYFKKYYRDGQVKAIGSYRNGLLDGSYKEFHENAQLAIDIVFDSGRESGDYKKYYASGQVKEEGHYVDGKAEGTIRSYHEKGQVAQESVYHDGKPEGTAKAYYPNGILKEEANYFNGKLNGTFRTFHENASLKFIVTYEEGKREGEFSLYDKNSRLENRGTFVQDQLEGPLLSFYPSGVLKSEVSYRGGQAEGIGREYTERGVLRHVDTFVGGQRLKSELFDDEGRKINRQTVTFKLNNGLAWEFPIKAEWPGLVLAFVIGWIGSFWLTLKFSRKPWPAGPLVLPPAKPTKSEADRDLQVIEHEFNLLRPESEKLYRHLIETVKNGIFLSSPQGKLLYVNHAFARILGYDTKIEVIGMNLQEQLVEVNDLEESILVKLSKEHSVKDHLMKRQRLDGATVILTVSANQITNDRGELVGVEGVIADITEKNRLQDELLFEKRKLESIMEFHEQIDSIRDYSELVQFAVKGVCYILEAQRCSLMIQDEATRYLKIIGAQGISEDIIKSTKVELGKSISGQVAQEGKAIIVPNIEYDTKWHRPKMPYYLGRSFVIVPFRLENQLVGVINVADKNSSALQSIPFSERDLKVLNILTAKIAVALDNIRLLADLNLLTVTDPMTQIFNYRRFLESLEREMSRGKREAKFLSIAMMDIDHFKTVNDTLGHLEGDSLLRTFGEILKKQLRETDIICRYAGDEFCIVFPETTADGAKNAAEKIRKVVERYPFKLPVTLSVGIAQFKTGMTVKDFIQQADQALYQAKKEGRNRVIARGT